MKRISEVVLSMKVSTVVILILLITALYFSAKIELNNDPSVYLPKDSKALKVMEEVEGMFPAAEVIVVLFEGENLFSPKKLTQLNSLTENIKALDLVDKVYSLSDHKSIRASGDNGFSVEKIVDLESIPEKKELLSQLKNDRFVSRLLLGNNDKSYGMAIVPAKTTHIQVKIDLENKIRSLIKEEGLGDEFTSLAGQVAIDNAQFASMVHDMSLFLPIISLLAVVLIWYLYKSFFLSLVAFLSSQLVIMVSASVYGLINEPFNIISTILPSLVSAITTASSIHYFNALVAEGKVSDNLKEVAYNAMKKVKKPILYTCLTTAAGMLSLSFSPIRPITTIGIVGAFGIMLIYFVICYICPPFIARYIHLVKMKSSVEKEFIIDAYISKTVKFSIRYSKSIVVVFFILMALMAPLLFKINTETSLIKFFNPEHPISISNNNIQEKLTGLTPVNIIFYGDEANFFKAPERLRKIREFQKWVDDHSQVSNSFTMPEFLEEMHWAFNAEKPSFRSIPDSEQLVAQYLFIYGEDDIYDFVNTDFDISRMTINLNVQGSTEIKNVLNEFSQYLKEHPLGFRYEFTSFGKLFSDQAEMLVTGQVRSLWGALLILFLFMYWCWRNTPSAFVSMLPNAIPVYMMFIIMALFSIPLDMSTAMISSVVIGIAIDDTIHLYHGFLSYKRAGNSTADSLVKAYAHVGRAITATTFVLCFQFLVLAFSNFVPIHQFGQLCFVGLILALVFDVLLLPAIIVVWDSLMPSRLQLK